MTTLKDILQELETKPEPSDRYANAAAARLFGLLLSYHSFETSFQLKLLQQWILLIASIDDFNVTKEIFFENNQLRSEESCAYHLIYFFTKSMRTPGEKNYIQRTDKLSYLLKILTYLKNEIDLSSHKLDPDTPNKMEWVIEIYELIYKRYYNNKEKAISVSSVADIRSLASMVSHYISKYRKHGEPSISNTTDLSPHHHKINFFDKATLAQQKIQLSSLHCEQHHKRRNSI